MPRPSAPGAMRPRESMLGGAGRSSGRTAADKSQKRGCSCLRTAARRPDGRPGEWEWGECGGGSGEGWALVGRAAETVMKVFPWWSDESSQSEPEDGSFDPV